MTGPALESTNVAIENVKTTESGYWPLTAGQELKYSDPPHSMAAWELTLTADTGTVICIWRHCKEARFTEGSARPADSGFNWPIQLGS